MTAWWAALGLAVLAGLVLLLVWAKRQAQAPAPGLPADLRWIYTTHGRGGSTIRSVQDRTNAKIVVGKGDGVVRVRADDRRSVDQAVRMIHDIAVNGTSRFSDN